VGAAPEQLQALAASEHVWKVWRMALADFQEGVDGMLAWGGEWCSDVRPVHDPTQPYALSRRQCGGPQH
jgi:hypothetical protein